MNNFIFQKKHLVMVGLMVSLALGQISEQYVKLYVFLKLVYQKNFSIIEFSRC